MSKRTEVTLKRFNSTKSDRANPMYPLAERPILTCNGVWRFEHERKGLINKWGPASRWPHVERRVPNNGEPK